MTSPASPTPSPRAPAPTRSAAELNSDRVIVSVLREVCQARGIELTAFSSDWLFHLRRGNRSTHVFGYDFSLNSATTKIICKDKSATSDLLHFHGVPRVEHRLFHGPQLTGYVPLEGNWQPMCAFFEACGRDVVCKPNEGSGGRGVIRAQTPAELEAAVLQIFDRSRSLCLSPYEKIEGGEYRVAILRGEIQFVYRKDRPVLAGDGQRTLRELVLARLNASATMAGEIAAISQAIRTDDDYARVLRRGEEVLLNWRHNLAQGSAPTVFDPLAPEIRPLGALAVRAAEALKVVVASVDIAMTPAGPKVLEVNSGIMMESLAANHPDGLAMAYRFYDRILCAALEIESEARP